MAAETLIRCPKCKGTPEKEKKEGRGTLIKCTRCPLKTEVFHDPQEAVDMWNAALCNEMSLGDIPKAKQKLSEGS